MTVQDKHYLVLGDNTATSFDSRYWGYVPRGKYDWQVVFHLLADRAAWFSPQPKPFRLGPAMRGGGVLAQLLSYRRCAPISEPGLNQRSFTPDFLAAAFKGSSREAKGSDLRRASSK